MTFQEVKGVRSEVSIRRPLNRFDGAPIVKLQQEFLAELAQGDVGQLLYQRQKFNRHWETVQTNVEASIFLSAMAEKIFL